MNFDWNYARAFLACSQHGSFSAAAPVLGISQPTLSRQIATLEQQLGVVVFERLGSGLSLTAAGKQLLSHVEAMSQHASALSLQAEGQAEGLHGRVVISASELDGCFRLPPVISKLRQQQPGIELEIVIDNNVSDLSRREADIALRSFRPSQHELIARKICDEPIALYGSHDYVQQLQTLNQQQLFQQVQIIGFEHKPRLAQLLNQQGWQLTEKNFALVCKFQMMQLQLVERSLGLGFFPMDIAENNPTLRAFYLNKDSQAEPPLTLELWLVSHRELRTSARVKYVFDLMAAELSADSYPFQ